MFVLCVRSKNCCERCGCRKWLLVDSSMTGRRLLFCCRLLRTVCVGVCLQGSQQQKFASVLQVLGQFEEELLLPAVLVYAAWKRD